jgi:hypothetical protein
MGGGNFLNKTGPIKLSHTTRSNTHGNISSKQHHGAIDDILGNGSTDEIFPKSQKHTFSHTQKFNNSLSGALNDERPSTGVAAMKPDKQPRPQQQKPQVGSRRELNEKQQIIVQGNQQRPGTAP